MACYHPRQAWRSVERNESGKRPIVFYKKNGYEDLKTVVPCGGCLGCRIDKARSWAIRCVHEASLFKKNAFITLTFNNHFIDKRYSLNPQDFVKFIKRLRKRFYGCGKSEVRYFHCGEYGTDMGRPHHHACLFGLDFDDKQIWSVKNGVRLYRSETLERCWSVLIKKKDLGQFKSSEVFKDGKRYYAKLGFATIGEVNFMSAAYVARYIVKKITGDMAPAHYLGRKPEYITMSRKPGIGALWIEKYMEEAFDNDKLRVHGDYFVKVPMFYNRKMELTDPERYNNLLKERRKLALESKDNTPERLAVREHIEREKWRHHERSFEGHHGEFYMDNEAALTSKLQQSVKQTKKYILKTGRIQKELT